MVIFIFVVLYMGITIWVDLMKTEITIYEVPLGQLYSKEVCKGLIVRDEVLYAADTEGYVNYYFNEGDKVSKNENIYSIGSDSLVYDRISSEKETMKLTSDEISDLKYYINKTYFKASDFSEFGNARDEIMKYYRRIIDRKVMTRLNTAYKINGRSDVSAGFKIVSSDLSGIISYHIDNYSDVNVKNFNGIMFDAEYASEYTYKTDKFERGNIVYKLVTSDDWQIIVRLTDDMYRKLADCKTVTFTLNGDKEFTAPVTFMRSGDTLFAVLSMDRYISYYLDERFAEVSFDTEETVGLKLPVSSLVYKDFYRIPESYFMTHENSEGEPEKGLCIERHDDRTGEKTYHFLKTDIFWTDDGNNYVSADIVNSGEYICKPDSTGSTELYVFNVKLEGAYNVNNGFAAFRRIERMETGSDYVLAKRNSASGLSAYDHIALKGDTVHEGKVIY